MSRNTQRSLCWPRSTPDWIRLTCERSFHLVSQACEPIVCGIVVGSSCEQILANTFTEFADIDLVFVIERTFEFGAILFDVAQFEQEMRNSLKWLPYDINISYNGVPFSSCCERKETLELDFIPQSIAFIHEKDCQSVLDMAKRFRILVTGTDVYQPLAETPISYDLVQDRMKATKAYIKRGLDRNMGSEMFWMQYIAKSALLLTSYLIIEEEPSVKKDVIAKNVSEKYEILSTSMDYYLKIYQGQLKTNTATLMRQFELYCNKLDTIFRLEYE